MVDQIKQTETFKLLDPTRQKVFSSSSVTNEIRRQFPVAKTMGFHTWVNSYNPSAFCKNVIRELLDTAGTNGAV